MYSRDVFPRYSAGGLPIPENYSGNAVRRAPAGGTAHTPPPRVHTPTPRGAAPQVPLTVSPSFAARQERESPRESAEAERGRPETEETRPPKEGRSMPPPRRAEEAVGEAAREEERLEETRAAAAEPVPEKGAHPDGGIASILSALMPPKIGNGGALSQIGLEEALLLGLFLLLSQSEEDDDTLLLLALLFLYR